MKTTLCYLIGLSMLLGLRISAQETPTESAAAAPATTTADPTISPTKLRILVRPLTKDEAKVELDSWLDIVKAKAIEIRDLELQVSADSSDTAANQQLLELKSERAELIVRTNFVLQAFAARGGDASDSQKYLKQVQTLNAPTTDVKAAINTVKAWASSNEGGLKWLRNLGLFALTLLIFRLVSRFVSKLVSKAVRKFPNASSLLHQFLTRFSRGAIMLVGVVVALSYLGVNIAPLIAAMGAIGFILAFALQGTLSNFAAGIMILLYKPYDLGDVITAASVTGKVDSMNLVSTTLKTPDNQSVIVPNSSIWGDVITNITANSTRRVDLTIGIGYEDNIDTARQALLSVVQSHDKVLADPEPAIEVSELADSSVNLIVRPWCLTADYWRVHWDLTKSIKERLDAEGINIPYPQSDIHVHQAK